MSASLRPPSVRVYASLSSYLLGRLIGSKQAEAMLTEIVRTGAEPNGSHVPGALALHSLARLYDVTLRVDGGAVCIAKTRSRHLHAALDSLCDVWVTVDDDVGASPETLRWLVEAVSQPDPTVCIAPYPMRNDPGSASIEWRSVYAERGLPRGGVVRTAYRGGFGLVAINRAAMREVALASPLFTDDDGVTKAAAFIEKLGADGKWLGEDYSFYSRLPGSVSVVGLITGETMHGPHKLKLEEANV